MSLLKKFLPVASSYTLALLLFVGAGLLLSHSSLAERIGDFDIMVQPVNSESGDVTARGYSYTTRSKAQTLVYKVRVDYKGLQKLEHLELSYIIVYRGGGSEQGESFKGGQRLLRGKKEFQNLAPLEKIEFNTTGIENQYTEDQWWHGGKSKYGKATLKGIAIRMKQGDKILATFGSSSDLKGIWNEIPEAKEK
jgi:hypothetical protein